MNYGPGDTVICVDATPTFSCGWSNAGEQIKVGEIYRVLSMHQCNCGRFFVQVTKVRYLRGGRCECGMIGEDGNAAWRFIKLPRVTNEQEQEATV